VKYFTKLWNILQHTSGTKVKTHEISSLASVLYGPLALPEVGRITLKINGDEALSDESV
jgi:hypothetical protein